MTGYVKNTPADTKKSKKRLPLSLLCYVAVLVVWLGVSTTFLVADMIAKGNGSLSSQLLSSDAFTTVDMEKQPDGGYYSISEDPQMILDMQGKKIRTLRFKAVYSLDGAVVEPNEVGLYYVAPGEVDEAGRFKFGEHKWVRPSIQEDGSYLFNMPWESIQAIRLDPASRIVFIHFEEIELNQPVSWLSYYNPGWAGFTLLLVLPALLAAVLRWLLDTGWHVYARFASRRWQREKEAEIEKNRQNNSR